MFHSLKVGSRNIGVAFRRIAAVSLPEKYSCAIPSSWPNQFFDISSIRHYSTNKKPNPKNTGHHRPLPPVSSLDAKTMATAEICLYLKAKKFGSYDVENSIWQQTVDLPSCFRTGRTRRCVFRCRIDIKP